MVEYVYGVVLNKKDKVGYIIFVMNVILFCDCVFWLGRLIVYDIGILVLIDFVVIE